MNEFDEAADIICSLTRRVLESERWIAEGEDTLLGEQGQDWCYYEVNSGFWGRRN
jgi:hypothetical protein